MIDGKPAVFISHSEASKASVARPLREFINSCGLYGVIVSDEPLPEGGAPDPAAKVDFYLNRSSMLVALATPDSKLDSGEINTRQNIVLEINSALERPHLRDRVLVFRAPDVQLPSNINPVYEALNLAAVAEVFPVFERQARKWELLTGRPDSADPVGPSAPDPVPDRPPTAGDPGVDQAVAALLGLSRLLAGEEGDSAGAIASRAHLATSTALSLLRSTEDLGVHELNGLYRDRSEVQPTEAELAYLFRTVIANIGAANAPGWYWFRSAASSEVMVRVCLLALGSSGSAAARRAVEVLTKSERAPSSGQRRAILRAALGGKSDLDAGAALAMLARHGTRTDLRALRSELAQHEDAAAVAKAVTAIQSREAPATALRRILKRPDDLEEAIEENLLQAARQLPESLIRKGLGSGSAALDRLALRLLDSASRLRKADVLGRIETEEDSSVRLLACELALKRRWKLSEEQFQLALKDATWQADTDGLHVRFVELRSTKELYSTLRWFVGDSYWIYEALARKDYPRFRDRLFGDLETDFAELRATEARLFEEEFREAVEAKFSLEHGTDLTVAQRTEIADQVRLAARAALEKWSKVGDYVLRRFRVAALRVLAENPSPDNARFGREFLGSEESDTASLAIEVLRQSGGQEDVPSLLEVAESSWRHRGEAAEAALELSDDRPAVARSLLAMGHASVVRVGLNSLGDQPLDGEAVAAIWPLLRHEDLATREAASDFLVRKLARSRLQKLLDLYPEGQYYYSVMARIDRELYAPAWIRQSALLVLGG